MEKGFEKRCPVCGERVIGRIDKKFCTDECRTHANNLKRRERMKMLRMGKRLQEIEKDLIILESEGNGRYIKIIAAVILFCKIIYKFGHQNKRT